MKIVKDLPPIYDQILINGMKPDPNTTVFTYGDTLYVPSGREVEPHLMAHEETHSKQQGANPDGWWSRYMDDQYFRIAQESEAYAAQYDHICKNVKDRNYRNKVLQDFGRVLASPLYGKVVGQIVAVKMIKDKSKTK
jgi:hypothetical protein